MPTQQIAGPRVMQEREDRDRHRHHENEDKPCSGGCWFYRVGGIVSSVETRVGIRRDEPRW